MNDCDDMNIIQMNCGLLNEFESDFSVMNTTQEVV